MYTARRHIIQGCFLILPDRSLDWMAGEGQVFVELMRSACGSGLSNQVAQAIHVASHDHEMI